MTRMKWRETETCCFFVTFESRTIYYQEQEYQTRGREKKFIGFINLFSLQFDHLNASSTERMIY